MHPIQDLFLKGFSYVLQIDMHHICAPMLTKFYSCKIGCYKAPALRWTFEVGIRKVACEALAILRHEADEQMAHLQYRHFSSRAEEGAKAVILLVGGHDCMGCFTDQLKLTRALVQDLDEANKEIELLGEHEEEPS
jgi:hypothetical protein